ncbi:MAG: hypothetical protein EBX13_04440 [Proteobacteria bacterium]|nr:hypothetical protein [Pseudomonadota bacterium]
MGADFTFATFPYFDMTDERRESFRESIANLTKSEIDEFQEWYGLDDDDYDTEELLQDIEDACSTCSRETCTMRVHAEGGQPYDLNITGGMSWGDPPTDVMSAFERASFFEDIYQKAIDYSIEYCKMYGATA